MKYHFCLLADDSSIHVLDVCAEVVLAVLSDKPYPLTSWHFDLQLFGWIIKMIDCEIVIALLTEFKRHDRIMLEQHFVITGCVVQILWSALHSSFLHGDLAESGRQMLAIYPHLECELVGA